ncbi:carbohydrate ABC transporter permease [candidate division WOR-3 bacterium]|uniref:Carbohydrate ABC transporter permease n=1 Tax=candidate division WOR-3 bacterium TaxID=2052148 RepID=A0A7C5HFB6_UNCW3|nr:carbohydrate ABC transporter permease [candidate division WOR-3 bacterium]HHE04531.1 carbohydrate ABC transporter permease [candidate division WOR-3 bacterium]
MKDEIIRKGMLTAGIIFLVFFCIGPFIWMIVVSLSDSPDFLVRGQYIFTLKNFIDILNIRNLHFLDYLRNSLFVAGLTSIFSATIGAFAAYAISRIDFRGKILILVSVLGLSMFPQISIVGYLYKIMSSIGWINTYNALVFPYIAWTLPLSLWLMLSYFSQIPSEIDRAALVDGANRIQVFSKIIIPIGAPGFLSTVLLLFMASFNEFLFALMLTTDFRARTIPVGIALFEGLHGEIPWGYIMAASLISSIPVILLALFFQRYIIRGLTGGAVKQ